MLFHSPKFQNVPGLFLNPQPTHQQTCFQDICSGLECTPNPGPPGSSHGGFYYVMHNTPFCTGMGTEHTQDCQKQWPHTCIHTPCASVSCVGTQPAPRLREAKPPLAWLCSPAQLRVEGVNRAAAEPGFSFGHAFCCPIG